MGGTQQTPTQTDRNILWGAITILVVVAVLGVVALLAACAPRTPTDERGCYTIMWPAPPKIVCPK